MPQAFREKKWMEICSRKSENENEKRSYFSWIFHFHFQVSLGQFSIDFFPWTLSVFISLKTPPIPHSTSKDHQDIKTKNKPCWFRLRRTAQKNCGSASWRPESCPVQSGGPGCGPPSRRPGCCQEWHMVWRWKKTTSKNIPHWGNESIPFAYWPPGGGGTFQFQFFF